jgi:hypothetical protein
MLAILLAVWLAESGFSFLNNAGPVAEIICSGPVSIESVTRTVLKETVIVYPHLRLGARPSARASRRTALLGVCKNQILFWIELAVAVNPGLESIRQFVGTAELVLLGLFPRNSG